MTRSTPNQKSRFLGRYLVQERLAEQNGIGVFLAGDEVADGTPVVLKVARGRDPDLERVRRLAAEAKILFSLQHPSIVRALDYGVDSAAASTVLVLERARGRPLADIPWEPGLVRAALPEILRALSALHARDLLHLDLKPSNVFLDQETGRATLIDFDLATSPREARGRGTVPFAAPEIMGSGAPIDGRADLFSLGVLLATWAGCLGADQASGVGKVALELPATYGTGLCEFVRSLTSPEPASRPASARGALEVLGRDTPLLVETGETRRALLQMSPFVGRRAELSNLFSAIPLERPRRSRAPVVLLRSGVGVGRSRFLEEAAQRWRESGTRVLLVRPDPGPVGTLRPVMDLLALLNDPRDSDRSLEPARLLAHREWSFDRETSRILRELRGDRCVLIAEDIHRYDLPSREFFLHLARRVAHSTWERGGRPPLELVFSEDRERYRDDSLKTWLDGEVAGGQAIRIDLEPFDPALTASLFAGLISPERASPELALELHARTGGVPLFVRETLLAHALEPDGGGTLLGSLSVESLQTEQVPSSLEMVVRGRQVLCTPTERSHLQVLAIFPTGVQEAVVADLTGGLGDTPRRLAALKARGLAVEHGGRWHVAESVTRTVVLGQTAPEWRRASHDRAALSLERHGGTAEEIAYQLLKGRDPAQGVGRLLERAYDLLASGQEEEAVRYLDEVAREGRVSPFARRLAALKLFDVRFARGQIRRARSLIEQLQRPRPRLDLSAERRRASLLLREGQGAAGREILRALAQNDLCFTEIERVGLWVELVESLVQEGRILEARQAFAAIFDLTPPEWPFESLLNSTANTIRLPKFPWPRVGAPSLARLLLVAADLARAEKNHRHSRSLHRVSTKLLGRLRDLSGLARARHGIASACLALGEHEEAERHFHQAIELREQGGDLFGMAESANNLGVLLRKTGRGTEAIERFRLALRLRRQIGHSAGEAGTYLNIANVHLERRELRAARRHLRRALAVARRLGDRRTEAQVLNNLGALSDLQDRFSTAHRAYRQAEELDRLVGNIAGALTKRLNRAGVCVKVGALKSARYLIETVRRAGERRKDAAILLQVRLRSASVELACDRANFSLLSLESLWAEVSAGSDPGLAFEVAVELSEAAIEVRRPERAEPVLATLATPVEAESRARAALIRGKLARLRDDTRGIEVELQAIEEGARFARRSGLHGLEHQCEAGRAGLVESLGEPALALGAYAAAQRALETILSSFRSPNRLRAFSKSRLVRRFEEELRSFASRVRPRQTRDLLEEGRLLVRELRGTLFEAERAVPRSEGLTQDEGEQLRRTVELSRQLRSTAPLDELLRSVVDAALDFSRAERGFLITVDARGRLRIPVALTRTREPIAGADREISHRLAKEVLATGKSVRLSNALAESAWSEQASVVNLDLRSIMCVPLFRGADVVGLLYLDNRTRAGQFSAHDLQLIEIFASQAAAALDNARLARQFAREEKIRVLGNLAGGVAHDFNNLLSVVLGKLQEVLNSQGLPMESERRLRSAEKAALDGAAIVRRLQDFSRLRRASDFAPLRLAELVEDVLEFTRVRRAKDRRQGNRSIEVRVEISEDLFVPGDASELREVFTNLVLNAVSAMPEGGQLSFFATTKDDRVTIQVEDTGVGMTEEVRESLFDPYFTTREKDGLGLGMSIVLGIILRHRGSVRVESTPGEGSRIFVELPLAAAPEAAAPVAVRNEVSSAAQGGRVLVVDDEESVRELLESALTRAGYDCVPVGDGRMAQAELERAEFDAVVTDLGMVPVSGRDLAAWIRARELGCAVLLVTGWSGEIDAAKAAEWGVDRVLPKPFDLDGVAMAVSEEIARRKQSPVR
jgi:signal transduction histidine kinase/CheY-like chemotaxis protein/tetratricopeptide (TPR) repeat protein